MNIKSAFSNRDGMICILQVLRLNSGIVVLSLFSNEPRSVQEVRSDPKNKILFNECGFSDSGLTRFMAGNSRELGRLLQKARIAKVDYTVNVSEVEETSKGYYLVQLTELGMQLKPIALKIAANIKGFSRFCSCISKSEGSLPSADKLYIFFNLFDDLVRHQKVCTSKKKLSPKIVKSAEMSGYIARCNPDNYQQINRFHWAGAVSDLPDDLDASYVTVARYLYSLKEKRGAGVSLESIRKGLYNRQLGSFSDVEIMEKLQALLRLNLITASYVNNGRDPIWHEITENGRDAYQEWVKPLVELHF